MFGFDNAIGAVLGAAGGFLSASKQKNALENFKLQRLNLESPDVAQQEFGAQIGKLPDVAKLLGTASDLDNTAVTNRILSDDPNAGANTQATSELALSRSLGGLTQDTQDAIKRANAYAALQGGFAGSSMQTNNEALKIAQAKQQAVGQAPGLNSTAMSMSRAFTPENPDVAGTLISPEAILQRDDSEDTYNTDINNQYKLAQLSAVTAGQNKTAGNTAGAGAGIAGLLGGGGGGGIGSLLSMI